MALSVRAKDVEDDARLLARRKRTSVTGAIRLALKNELARDDLDKEAEFQKAWAELQKIQASYLALPPSGLTEQDIMGWDENGLPT